MYLPGQIVYDRDRQVPIRIDDPWVLPKTRTTHFLKYNGVCRRKGPGYVYELELFLPKSIEEAEELLHKGFVVPGCIEPTHCWRCGNWKKNCRQIGRCPEHARHEGGGD